MTKYVAIINTPGYLPTDDEPPTFDTAREAWSYLYDERLDEWSNYEYENYVRDEALLSMLQHPNEVGTVYGSTPGYDGDHDLGIAYSVEVAEDL